MDWFSSRLKVRCWLKKWLLGVLLNTRDLLKNVVFWDVTSCGSCKNRRFGGTYHFRCQGDKNQRARNNVSNTWNTTYLPHLCLEPFTDTNSCNWFVQHLL
jgi:hypothetical protein